MALMVSLTKKIYLSSCFFVAICFSVFILNQSYQPEVYPVDMSTNQQTSFIPPLPQKQRLTHSQKREIKCLSENMYYEAKGEGVLGWLAVGMVTMNRVNSGRFPDDVCAVVYQNNGKVFQFSWVANKKRLTINNKELYNRIHELATIIYFEYENLYDVTDRALFFHAEYVSPGWSKRMEKTAQIGRHIFYKL